MNSIPSSIIPAKRRVRRKRKSVVAPAPPGPPALVLESAVYIAGSRVLLTFDRDIDAAGFDPAQVLINDGDNSQVFEPEAGVPSVVGALVVIMLAPAGPFAGSGLKLNATGSTGIVAVDDGGTWAGAMDLSLPFP